MSKSLSKNTVRCLYCGSNRHKINNCSKDRTQIHMVCQNIHDGTLTKQQLTYTLYSVSRLNLYRIIHFLRWSRDLPAEVIPVRVRHDSTQSVLKKTISNVHRYYRSKYLEKCQDNCPVCLEQFSKTMPAITTPCNHNFCLSCYTRTVASSGHRASCPMCRGALV